MMLLGSDSPLESDGAPWSDGAPGRDSAGCTPATLGADQSACGIRNGVGGTTVSTKPVVTS